MPMIGETERSWYSPSGRLSIHLFLRPEGPVVTMCEVYRMGRKTAEVGVCHKPFPTLDQAKEFFRRLCLSSPDYPGKRPTTAECQELFREEV